MLFSCKISSAILAHFDEVGEDLTPLLESTTLPEEFLRDPSYWMKAADMETFLQTAQKICRDDGPIFQKIGHSGPELRAWGVLDSVLRMMPRPQEILAQPQRFLSYFISPEPPVENLRRTDSSIEFDLPVSSEIYPLVTSYLKAAFESLPVYVGQSLAQASWHDIHLKLSWVADQESMFEKDPGHSISPELLRSVVASLENHQRELEEKNRDLQERNELLARAHREMEEQIAQKAQIEGVLSETVHRLDFIDESSIQVLRHNLAKLTDYMVRAQQLITMLVGSDRMKPVVKESMKRTDWERVKLQFPLTVQESRDILDKTQKKYEEQPYV
jgi:hypothetical protein